MSLWRDEIAPSRTALVAVAILSLIAAASLERTFTTARYLAWALPAMGAGAAFALAFGRRSLGLAFAGLLLVAGFTMPALFARDATLALFPTPSAVAELWALLGNGITGVMHEAAPVPPEPRFLSVIWLLSLVLGFLGAAWVVVGRPVGAVVTSLGVVAFAGSVGEGPGQMRWAGLAVAAAGAFFLADGRHRISSWGRRPVTVPGHVGVATLVAAVTVGLLTPTLIGAAEPLVDLDGTFRPRLVVIKPLSDVQRQLQVDPPIEVMRVSAARSTYWRLTGLDTYTGDEWILEARPEPATNGPVPTPEPSTGGETLLQEYRITSLLAPWLPAAYAAVNVDTPVPFEIDAGSSTLLIDGDSLPGLNYTVLSQLPADATGATPLPGDGEADPEGNVFGDVARGIVGGASTPLEQAVALEQHFRGYDYDEDAEGGHTEERLTRFLEERRGYCEQFAATMTLMLRALGVPARVAVGFLPGSREEFEHTVTTDDAHAWVEADIPGAGWVTFDPTPGRGQPAGGDPSEPEEAESEPTPVPAAVGSPAPPTPAPQQPEGTSSTNTDTDGVPTVPTLAMVAALLVGAVPGAKTLRRRMRRTGTPREAVAGAWQELVDGAADLGWQPRTSETPWEFRRRVFGSAEAAGGPAAERVTAVVVASSYAPGTPDRADAETAWRHVGPAIAGLRRCVPWWRRVVAVFDPRTLLPRGRLTLRRSVPETA